MSVKYKFVLDKRRKREDKIYPLKLRTYDNDEFAKIWNGVIFAIHDSKDVEPGYNRDEEWSPWALAPLGQPLGDQSLSHFTREMPPLYQITSLINGSSPATP